MRWRSCLALLLGCSGGNVVLPPPPPPPPPPPFLGPTWQTSKRTELPPPPVSDKPRVDPSVARPVRIAGELERPQRNQGATLGVNMGSLALEDGAWSFLDVFKRAGPWVSNTWDKQSDGRRISVGPKGWVNELLPSQYVGALVPAEDGGTYQLTYEGDAIVRLERARALSEEPGKITFKAPAGSYPMVAVYRNELRDPLRNVTVVKVERASDLERQVFREDFLKLHERFGALRFSGWSRIDEEPPGRWSERVEHDFSHQYGERGVALEYMVILSNRLSAAPWLMVPHSADDAYAESMAAFLKANLRPELKVYIEYTNEPWREGAARRWCAQEASRAGIEGKGAPDGRLYHALRSVEIFKIFEAALGRGRLVRVLSAPLGEAEPLLGLFQQARLAGQVDALAVAPYFGEELSGPEWVTRLREVTDEELLDFLEKRALARTLTQLEASAKAAKALQVPLIGYGGGLRLEEPEPLKKIKGVVDFLDQMAAHPRVGKMYEALFASWQQAGGGMLVLGPLVGAAREGALRSMADAPLRSARYQAMMRRLDQRPQLR